MDDPNYRNSFGPRGAVTQCCSRFAAREAEQIGGHSLIDAASVSQTRQPNQLQASPGNLY